MRTDPESIARMHWTRQWWQENSQQFELFTSAAVVLELGQGSTEKTPERLELIARLPLLEITDAIEHVVETYIARKAMPNDPGGDALHLAVASYYRLDVLLTWNCRHLANPNKMEHIRRVNEELGLPLPLLTTPLNYVGGGDKSD
ncbi:MAG TPA: type II toxin-antitoxin system VapC family toxin [Pirellulaceae bacterium]